MLPTLNPWRLFLLWRSGCGFGIHSPFAFRFVTEVLRQPYSYYGYAELPDRRSRLLLRLLVAFRPERVAFYGGDDALRRAVSLANSRAKIIEGESDAEFVVADCRGWSSAEVSALFNRQPMPAALLLNCRSVPALADHGMTFNNHRGTVVVAPLPHLPRQDFDLRF